MWYYLENGTQRGPVDQAAFDQLVNSGAVLPATLVWREGQAEWLPWQSVSRGGPVVPALVTCSICGKPFPADQVIDLVGQTVCAGCKPLAVQGMKEGVAPAGAGVAWADSELVVTRDGATLPSRCYKCNQPTSEKPLRSRFVWHHPALHFIWLGLLLHVLGTVVVYIVVVRIFGRRGSASLSYCKQHLRTRHRNAALLTGCSILIGLAFYACIAAKKPLLALGILAVAVLLQIVWIRGGFVPRAKRVENATLWLTSAGRDFLASLPAWVGDKT